MLHRFRILTLVRLLILVTSLFQAVRVDAGGQGGAQTSVSISVASPATGTVTISSQTKGSNLAALQIFVDGQLAASCASPNCSYAWNTLTVSNGLHAVYAIRTDKSGATTSSSVVNVTVANDTTAPSVSVAAPSSAAATVTISVSATDAGGVAWVKLYLDGALLQSAASGSLTYAWDSTTVVNGTHSFQATAADPSGNVGSSAPASVMVENGPDISPATEPLIQPANLVYQGAFRLPRGSFCASPSGISDSFAYGGTALAYDASRNGLYLVGHDVDQMTAEVSIPDAVNSTDLNALNTATVLQNCMEPTEGKGSQAGNGVKIGGQMVYDGNLYGTAYVYYDATNSQTVSHFVRPLTLAATGQVNGLFQVNAPDAGFVSGYLSPIPSEWQPALGGPAFTGQCCIPIVSRTSYGPAAFAFDPAQLGVSSPAPTTPLVYYENFNGDQHFISDWNVQSDFFNGATTMGGAIFIAGTRTVLFAGRQGIGPFCYGTGGASGGDCYDPASIYKGNHAYPYVYQIWAYDANDLASVASGRLNPWTIGPYGLWTLEFPIMMSNAEIKGVTYDPATRRVFMTQAYADGGDMPLVHVFQVTF